MGGDGGSEGGVGWPWGVRRRYGVVVGVDRGWLLGGCAVVVGCLMCVKSGDGCAVVG